MSAANPLSSASVGSKLAWPSGKNCTGGGGGGAAASCFVGFSTVPCSLQHDAAGAVASSRGGGGEQNSAWSGSKMGTR
uniref:Uncharacterized protein n=1 Tax=Arundo donax TaxID=35708 RepID=A0A0A9DC79_ARUDO